jgi:diaminopimelate decarboxylase
LILEPGRAVVKDAVELITTVVDVKELSNDTASVVVDSGINILPTSFWKFQQIEPINKKAVSSKETVVYGPLCLQTDILGITKLPDLNVGDRLVIKNVGAYNISQASSFIFPLPSIILTDNNKVKVLRSSETIKDVI